MRLSPQAFWDLSLSEWRWLAGAQAGERLDLADLKALAALYPDDRK